jgi:hypothetical protein
MLTDCWYRYGSAVFAGDAMLHDTAACGIRDDIGRTRSVQCHATPGPVRAFFHLCLVTQQSPALIRNDVRPYWVPFYSGGRETPPRRDTLRNAIM